MDEILELDAGSMGGISFKCSCGRNHSVDIDSIIIGRGVVEKVAQVCDCFRSGTVLLVADNNTYEVCGQKVEEIMKKNAFKVKTFVFETDKPLVPDERAVGRLIVEADDDISLILAVGSGTLNDLSRFVSKKVKIPYVIVCTAPSMDGYASTVSPLIVDGFKETYDGVYPNAIIADIDIMKQAPIEMIHAGFGDVAGKYTALADWQLSRELNGEYYCQTTVRLVRNALEKCALNAGRIGQRDEKAIESLIEALILTGVAIGLVGNSRPASGSEHLFAHYWEMEALAEGVEHPLHGNSVGVGTVITSFIFEMMSQQLPSNLAIPEPGYIRELLEKAGCAYSPVSLGISRELFKKSMLHAYEIRTRYSIMRFANEKGLLEEMTDKLVTMFYDEGI